MHLAEALPIEQARCREILAHAKELPIASGWYLVMTLQTALRAAERAAASNDVLAMLVAYKTLQDFKE